MGANIEVRNNLFSDPLFVSADENDGDFLKPGPGSAAMDMCGYEGVGTDYLNNIRPAGAGYDCGAFELEINGGAPVPPAGLSVK